MPNDKLTQSYRDILKSADNMKSEFYSLRNEKYGVERENAKLKLRIKDLEEQIERANND